MVAGVPKKEGPDWHPAPCSEKGTVLPTADSSVLAPRERIQRPVAGGKQLVPQPHKKNKE
jgi:hypothetical protein